MKHIPDIIQDTARNLRNNMTSAEIYLWGYIRDRQIGERFMKQKPLYVYTQDNGMGYFLVSPLGHQKK